MSVLKVNNIKHPDSEDSNLELDSQGNTTFKGDIKASSLKHPDSASNQITMNADGTIDASGLNVSNLSIDNEDIQDTISQTKLSLEKALTPDINDEYTIQTDDVGKVLTLDDEDSDKVVTVNIPADSQTNFEIGSIIKFYRENEANIAIKASENVSIRTPLAPGPYYFTRKYGEPQLRKRAQNQWVLTENGLLIQSLFATGGDEVFDEIIEGAVYRIHIFTTIGSSQAFEIETGSGGVEYLVVAGGGSGGGGWQGGSGGAGGYRSSVQGEASGGDAPAEPVLTVEMGSYAITVGEGGAGVGSQGNQGLPSKIERGAEVLVETVGGGYGGYYNGGYVNASNGGSGGGGEGYTANIGGTGTSGEGFDGGNGSVSSDYGAGGGGGSAAAGQNGVTTKGGDGGQGVHSNITGTSTRRAAGGGGSHGSNIGLGGDGGGGDGGTGSLAAVSGVANTGSGGGGARGNGATPGAGGSGIVILRYRIG